MKLGIDVDGVLADFHSHHIPLIERITGIKLPPVSDTYPDVWDYHIAGGVTKAQEKLIWAEIKSTQMWASLNPLPGAIEALSRLNALRYTGVESYFITSRSGRMAKFYTEMWLNFHGMSSPTVLISSDKGPVVSGLALDVFVDDRPENIQEVAYQAPTTNLYLVDQPWNRDFESKQGTRFERVRSLGEVLDREIPQSKLKEAA